ncbi:hypothetical protein BUALT_Bualt02G0048600 [Buddleja alternifolia]|uniref:C2H2-type domain-containing protein n=1 Tax=Buddleja alternifolia TaxID=168488 RepID=A0AAV6XXM2_9LAMI|nr:hypothetical protein BUALT_Bualt02G0048600 [Buddleja alternifolia]
MMSDNGLPSVPPSLQGFIQDPNPNPNIIPNPNSNSSNKRKRNLPGTPDPDAEVIALSPKSLMATNRFICEICNKGFQRDQNLQLHRRGHNLPWKLKQRSNKEVKKKVYICPEKTCVHHDPSRALGDLTGIKKHFSRKHGEKKWKCEKCSKKYAVQSDWKAHRLNNNLHGNSQFPTIFRPEIGGEGLIESSSSSGLNNLQIINHDHHLQKPITRLPLWLDNPSCSSSVNNNNNFLPELVQMASASNSSLNHHHQWNNNNISGGNFNARGSSVLLKEEEENNKGSLSEAINSLYYSNHQQETNITGPMSATALLQKAAQMGSTRSSNNNNSTIFSTGFGLMTSSFGNFNNSTMNPNRNVNEEAGAAAHGKAENSLIMASRNSTSENTLMVMPNSTAGKKLQRQSSGVEGDQNSMTRDFLGVGGNVQNRQFMQENHDQFGLMGSAMEMSHYRRNNQ